MYCVFLCGQNFILTYLKLPEISQTYLKIFICLEHLIKIHLKYYEKYFLGIFNYFTRSGIFHNLSINYSPSVQNHIEI